MDRSILTDVHRYWFGDLAGPDDYPAEKSKIWFQPQEAVDEHIRSTFGAAISEAAAADWPLAEMTRQEQIGLVVLLDQFPRNIHRTSGEAFAFDGAALRIATALIDGGVRRFFFPERIFLLLPLEHSEAVEDQDRAVLLYAELVAEAPPALLEGARTVLDFATKHRDLIRRFGRFPHRNALLGRDSTPEEEAFLKEHGRGF